MTLDAPHMLSFQPFLKLSSWGEGREASWAFQPPSPPPSQTLLGTPQGQLLLSLGAPQDGGQVAMGPASEREHVVSVCVCVWERRCCACDPVLFDRIHSVSPSICFHSHFSHCWKPSLFCLWETTGTIYLETRLCLSPGHFCSSLFRLCNLSAGTPSPLGSFES